MSKKIKPLLGLLIYLLRQTLSWQTWALFNSYLIFIWVPLAETSFSVNFHFSWIGEERGWEFSIFKAKTLSLSTKWDEWLKWNEVFQSVYTLKFNSITTSNMHRVCVLTIGKRQQMQIRIKWDVLSICCSRPSLNLASCKEALSKQTFGILGNMSLSG